MASWLWKTQATLHRAQQLSWPLWAPGFWPLWAPDLILLMRRFALWSGTALADFAVEQASTEREEVNDRWQCGEGFEGTLVVPKFE